MGSEMCIRDSPPNITKAKSERACEIINDNITQIKTKYESPVVILAGDFNQFDAKNCFLDHPDIEISDTPPSRNQSKIDLIATNIQESFVCAFATCPLYGIAADSDHKPITCSYLLPSSHCFTIKRYTTRKFVKKKEDSFVKELNNTD